LVPKNPITLSFREMAYELTRGLAITLREIGGERKADVRV
jgi:hypothetical protein